MKSDRLILRPWQLPADKESFFQIYQNSEVTDFLPRIRQLATDIESLNAHFSERLPTIRNQGNGSNWWAMIDQKN
ncbi:GNAT family N-acetyltransferase, partial [Microcystis aeruginosa KLA2]